MVWGAFVCFQAVGSLAPRLGNFHYNLTPVLLGAALLLWRHSMVTEIRIYFEGDDALRPGVRAFLNQIAVTARSCRCNFNLIWFVRGGGPMWRPNCVVQVKNSKLGVHDSLQREMFGSAAG